MKIGIFYGSTTGNTGDAANTLKEALSPVGPVQLNDIAGADVAAMAEYDLIILGSSTWGLGELQDDWLGKETLAGVDLAGKKAAVFGTGDQYGFADTFVDAIGALADAAQNAGATLIGQWPTTGYEYTSSAAVKDDCFVGLALDDDNQSEQTTERLEQWAEQLKGEL